MRPTVIDNGARREIEILGAYRGIAGLKGTLPNGGGAIHTLAFIPPEGKRSVASGVPVGTPLLIAGEPYRTTSVNQADPEGPFVTLSVRPDPEPWSSHPAAKRLDEGTLEALAEFVCGDAEQGPVHREGPSLERLFAATGLGRFSHDGSSRKWWTLAALRQCTPDEMVALLTRLGSPREYRGDERRTTSALDRLNAFLRPEGLLVELDGAEVEVKAVRPALTAEMEVAQAQSISDALGAFDARGVDEAWRKATRRADGDSAGAITSARSLIEEVCKTILDRKGVAYGPALDLPQLYSKAALALRLAPDQQSEQVFRELLGNCQSVVGKLAAIRNRFGDAHGAGSAARADARHARLAVGLAGSMSEFLVATYLADAASPGDDVAPG